VPNYDFKCNVCGKTFEMNVPMTAPNPTCVCLGESTKLPSAPGIAFRGPGFYVTDYKNR
jgi:putative FmdB family regulatory protein